ncbi:MAG: hypothetical protein U0325_12405 [Polyangiales bacterium]
MNRARVVLAAALAALSACGAGDTAGDGGACRAQGASAELGTGTNSSFANYRRLADGDPVYITPGAQGAQHVWIQVRARGMDPSRPRVSVRALRASDGRVLGELRLRVDLAAAPEDPSLVGLPSYALILDDATFCSVLIPPGDVRLVLDVEDVAARCVHHEVVVRVADLDPLTPPATRDAWRRCCTAREPRCAPRGDAG